MNKVWSIIGVLSIVSLGFVAGSQANSMAQRGFTTYDTTKLIGLTVKARDGVQLGKILDLVVDSHGHVDFAIVNQVIPPGAEDWFGHIVAVPFSALLISKGNSQKLQVVFNAGKEKFYEAPEAPSSFFHSGGQVSLQEATAMYRYFGVQPYWIEEGSIRHETGQHLSDYYAYPYYER